LEKKSKLVSIERVLVDGKWMPLLNINALFKMVTVQFGLVVYNTPKSMVRGWKLDILEIFE